MSKSAEIVLNNISIEKDLAVKLLAVDFDTKKIEVSVNGMKMAFETKSIDPLLGDKVGKLFMLSGAGDLTEAPSKTSAENAKPTRSSGRTASERGNSFNL